MDEDLVCRQRVEDAAHPRYFSDYDNRIYPFCSPECKRKFDDHPDFFIHQNARENLPSE